MNCILLFLVAIITAPISNAQCTGSKSSGVYNVSWTVSGGNVDFTVFADTTGWVGVGFSLTSNMVCKTYMYVMFILLCVHICIAILYLWTFPLLYFNDYSQTQILLLVLLMACYLLLRTGMNFKFISLSIPKSIKRIMFTGLASMSLQTLYMYSKIDIIKKA